MKDPHSFRPIEGISYDISVKEIIDQQRCINRLITLLCFIKWFDKIGVTSKVKTIKLLKEKN